MSAEPHPETLESQALARDLAQVISEAHGSDILVLDIAALTTLADYFLISTADNVRMLRAIIRALDEFAAMRGVQIRKTEGVPESGWVLIDFGDVIVHLFGTPERAFYELDRLWADAPRLLVIQ